MISKPCYCFIPSKLQIPGDIVDETCILSLKYVPFCWWRFPNSRDNSVYLITAFSCSTSRKDFPIEVLRMMPVSANLEIDLASPLASKLQLLNSLVCHCSWFRLGIVPRAQYMTKQDLLSSHNTWHSDDNINVSPHPASILGTVIIQPTSKLHLYPCFLFLSVGVQSTQYTASFYLVPLRQCCNTTAPFDWFYWGQHQSKRTSIITGWT